MPNCAHSGCNESESYDCVGCAKRFCDDHCANASYVQHLAKLGGVISTVVKKDGYACAKCLGQLRMPHNWSKASSTGVVRLMAASAN